MIAWFCAVANSFTVRYAMDIRLSHKPTVRLVCLWHNLKAGKLLAWYLPQSEGDAVSFHHADGIY